MRLDVGVVDELHELREEPRESSRTARLRKGDVKRVEGESRTEGK